MKKLLLLICLAGFASCEDSAYDLDKVDTDDVTIGGDGSVYKIPLATVSISMSEVGAADLDIAGIFEEADIWLPTTLPDGKNYVDLTELRPGTAYTQQMLDALLDEMATDEGKLDEVTDLIWREYKIQFIPYLQQIPGFDPNDKDTFMEVFKLAFKASDDLRNEARNIAQSYLIDLTIDPLNYAIDGIDLDDTVVDMLAKNLDPKGTPNAKNTLHLYGQITSELPVGMRLAPEFTGTNVAFDVEITPGQAAKIDQTQLFESDLRQIIAGTSINIPVTLLKYYRDTKFNDTQKISLRLSLVKRGGLTLDI